MCKIIEGLSPGLSRDKYQLFVSFIFQGLNCQDFSFDKCTTDLEQLLEVVDDIDQNSCQTYCDVIYPGLCSFFIYDRQGRTCSLLKQPILEYLGSCRQVAGPSKPAIQECREDTDPCNVRF